MRLVNDSIELAHGGIAVRLRPSLRVALHLERKFALGRVFDGINAGKLSVISETVSISADDPSARDVFIRRLETRGFCDLVNLAGPLFELVATSYGVEPSDDPEDEHLAEKRFQAGEPYSMQKALEELYSIATGWLGWPVDAALAATPSQIIVAQRGSIAKLQAIYGKADDTSKSVEDAGDYDPRDIPSDDEVRAGIAKLKTMVAPGSP